jgi:hypothetical protein
VYFSRRTRAERSTSIETRVTTAERKALTEAKKLGKIAGGWWPIHPLS